MRRSIIVALVPFLSFLLSVNAIAKTAAEIFEKASQSVVVVQIQDEQGKTIAFGSGVVLPSGDVATNCHVIEDAVGIRVYQGKNGYNASPRYNDWDRDVCSLSVPGMKAPSVSVGNTKTLKVGSRVFAIGTPQGLKLTLSDGIISNLRPVEGGQYLQITAPISPGSSGGGLFNEEGRLIGLTTFYIAEGQQLNFAVPVEWISELPKRHNNNLKTADTLVNWENQAVAFEEKKNWKGLLNHALKRTRVLPQDVNAWVFLGVAYSYLGQTADAIEVLHQALRINPKLSSAWAFLGEAYDALGQTPKAIEAYQQAIRIAPENEMGWANLGVIYGKSGQTAKSIEALHQALRINPEDFASWYNLGHAYGKSGQTAKQIEAYEQTVRINPENDEFWYSLGTAYGKSSQIAKEIEAYKQVIRINPEYYKAWYNIGTTYCESGQAAKAIGPLQQAVRINPEYAEAWYNLGLAYGELGQTAKVMEVYKRLKTINPAKADKLFNNIILP
jgi:tetratricopeptide (TPR) repeat protein